MNAELSAPFRDVLRFARRRHPEGGCSEVREPGVRRNNLGPFIVHESRPRPSLHTGRLCIRCAALDVVHVAPSASCPITNPRPHPHRVVSTRWIVGTRGERRTRVPYVRFTAECRLHERNSAPWRAGRATMSPAHATCPIDNPVEAEESVPRPLRRPRVGRPPVEESIELVMPVQFHTPASQAWRPGEKRLLLAGLTGAVELLMRGPG